MPAAKYVHVLRRLKKECNGCNGNKVQTPKSQSCFVFVTSVGCNGFSASPGGAAQLSSAQQRR